MFHQFCDNIFPHYQKAFYRIAEKMLFYNLKYVILYYIIFNLILKSPFRLALEQIYE